MKPVTLPNNAVSLVVVGNQTDEPLLVEVPRFRPGIVAPTMSATFSIERVGKGR